MSVIIISQLSQSKISHLINICTGISLYNVTDKYVNELVGKIKFKLMSLKTNLGFEAIVKEDISRFDIPVDNSRMT